jgi:hypothetical protein
MEMRTSCTQAEFAALVGVSQPAVSDMLARGVIKPGQTTVEWLQSYCAHLREQAAGRGGDGELAAKRAEESGKRTELLEIKIAQLRREVVPVAVLEQILAHLHRLCPDLPLEGVKLIEDGIAKACNATASMTLASLDELNSDGDEEGGQAP